MKRFITLTICLILSSPSFAHSETVPEWGTYTIERVIDGNTLKLTNGERVRLIGIDTPESKPNDKAKRDSERTGQDVETINKMGQESTEFVKGIVSEGQEIQLEFDVQERDKYGRLLAYVLIPVHGTNWLQVKDGIPISHLADGPYALVKPAESFEQSFKGTYPVNLNAYIIQSGYATPMTCPH